MTKKERTRDSAAVIDSTIPSARYSWSASPLMLLKGRTAIEGLLGSDGGVLRLACGRNYSPTRLPTLTTTLRQPGASASPAHPVRSAYWIVSNGIGSRVLSVVT